MNIASSIAHARTLWDNGRKLDLIVADRAKLTMAYYISRSALLGHLAPPHFTLQLPGGYKACIRPNGRDQAALAEIFGIKPYQPAQSAANPKRILDLGANIGMATLFLTTQFPDAEIASVEPFPGNLAILRENVRLNQIRSTIFAGAVGVSSGEAELSVGNVADAVSLVPASDAGRQTKLRVKQFSVDEIMDQLHWTQIDLLKIDIEGYEKTLFKSNNAWLGRVNQIVGEAHGHVGYGIKEVRADLEPFGFKLIEKYYDAVHELTIFEAIKCFSS
jgi:FkbM family methyltransferase